MKQQNTFSKIIIDVLISPKTTFGLFFTLICVLVPTTFSTALTIAMRIPVQIILVLIGLNLFVCTLSRLKSLRAATLIIHLGALIILIGGFINTLGYVATINIYEGDSINQVFRWDIEKDVTLGFDVRVAAINLEYYPVGVKIGVLENDRKEKLVVTRTGDSFVVDKFRILVGSLTPQTRDLELKVQSLTGSSIGTLSTAGRRDLPTDFTLDFKLVAFKTPDIKMARVNLDIVENGELVTSGTSEANHPFRWRGMQFFLTKVTTDTSNRSYAGIQISKAPGIPYVYGGFAVFCLGLLLLLGRWFKMMKIR